MNRSKCIHKMTSVVHIGIHHGTIYNKELNLNTDNLMFHFHTWGGELTDPYETNEGVMKINL